MHTSFALTGAGFWSGQLRPATIRRRMLYVVPPVSYKSPKPTGPQPKLDASAIGVVFGPIKRLCVSLGSVEFPDSGPIIRLTTYLVSLLVRLSGLGSLSLGCADNRHQFAAVGV